MSYKLLVFGHRSLIKNIKQTAVTNILKICILCQVHKMHIFKMFITAVLFYFFLPMSCFVGVAFNVFTPKKTNSTTLPVIFYSAQYPKSYYKVSRRRAFEAEHPPPPQMFHEHHVTFDYAVTFLIKPPTRAFVDWQLKCGSILNSPQASNPC